MPSRNLTFQPAELAFCVQNLDPHISQRGGEHSVTLTVICSAARALVYPRRAMTLRRRDVQDRCIRALCTGSICQPAPRHLASGIYYARPSACFCSAKRERAARNVIVLLLSNGGLSFVFKSFFRVSEAASFAAGVRGGVARYEKMPAEPDNNPDIPESCQLTVASAY